MKLEPVWELDAATRSHIASLITTERRESLHGEIGEMFKYLAVQPSESLLNDIIDTVLRAAP